MEYIPMLKEMERQSGDYYCRDPIGKCLRHKFIRGEGDEVDFGKNINLCMEESMTWAAFKKTPKDRIGDKFDEARAIPGELRWIDKMRKDGRLVKTPGSCRVLLDREAGVFRCEEERHGLFGCVEDVIHCFFVHESGKWELFNPSRSKQPAAYFPADEDLEHEAEQLAKYPPTTRKELIDARRGQGPFRKALINVWCMCAVSRCTHLELLHASHIKPWRRPTTDEERLDKFNGLLLAPNLHAAFDHGLISFNDDGRILISSKLSPDTCKKLGLQQGMKLVTVYPENRPYLEFHREHVYAPQ